MFLHLGQCLRHGYLSGFLLWFRSGGLSISQCNYSLSSLRQRVLGRGVLGYAGTDVFMLKCGGGAVVSLYGEGWLLGY